MSQKRRETVRGTIMAVAKVIQVRRETVRGTIVAVRNAASHGRVRTPGYRSCRRKRATHRFFPSSAPPVRHSTHPPAHQNSRELTLHATTMVVIIADYDVRRKCD